MQRIWRFVTGSLDAGGRRPSLRHQPHPTAAAHCALARLADSGMDARSAAHRGRAARSKATAEICQLEAKRPGGATSGGRRNESRGADAEVVLARANFEKRERSTAIALAANARPRELFSFYAAQTAGQKIADILLQRVFANLGAFECVALGYLAYSSAMIFLFARDVAQPFKLIGAQAIVATLILMICTANARAERLALQNTETVATRFWHFWRHWYPHLFFLFCFEELAFLVHLVNPKWQDAKLIAFDHALFGVHPAVWLEQFATPLRNDFFQFADLTYFLYLVVLGGILYYRREWHAYWSVMTYSAVGYAIGYVLAVIFPIESPWFAMAGAWHGEMCGGPFNAAGSFSEHFGKVRRAAV